MAGKLQSGLVNQLSQATSSPQGLSQDTARETQPSDGKANEVSVREAPERTEAPLDKDYLDSKIKLNKGMQDKRAKSETKTKAIADAKGNASEETQGAPSEQPPDDATHHPKTERLNEDGTKKSQATLREERIRELKRENEKYIAERIRLENEYKKALEEKDEISRKLIEREVASLESNSKAKINERFYKEAEEHIPAERMERFKDLASYYSPKLKANPNFQNIIGQYENRMEMLEHILGYIDDHDSPELILNNLLAMPERTLARTIRQVSETLNARKSAQPKKADAPSNIPEPVVATTPEEGTPDAPSNPTRHEALAHFKKHGRDFRSLLQQAKKN